MPRGGAQKPLSIALNLTFLVEESAGAGRYARELVRAILRVEPETCITAFVGSKAPRCPWGIDIADRIEVIRFPVPGTGFPPWHLVAQMGALPAMAARRRVDVIHGLANLVPPLSLTPTVVTILDVTWIHFPATMRRRATLARQVLVPVCARAADRVIAISEAAKRDLVRTLRLDSGKIDVTALGVRRHHPRASPPQHLRRKFGLGREPIVLSVAQKREHKNIASIIRGVAVGGVRDVQLVLPGAPTAHESELRALAAALGIADRVHFLPWLSDADLDELYGLASCFVLASFAEGFGLPILEAMSHGVPVACSNVSSMPEVAGGAALYFDPSSEEQIGRAIERLVRDRALADDLRRRGYERCDLFSWDETARRTLATYRRAIAGSRRRLASPAPGARGSAASPGAGSG
jgi:glycosyltransferase involved in cell wall biosynthesis